MKEQLNLLVELADPFISADGFNPTNYPSVRLFTTSKTIARQPIMYDSWIVMMLRGKKLIYHNGRAIPFEEGSVLCVTPGSPVECEMRVTLDKPLVCIVIDVCMDDLLVMSTRIAESQRGPDSHLFDVFPCDDELLQACEKLLITLQCPEKACILGDGIVTEIVYRVLKNGLAGSLRKLASNRNTAEILEALQWIKKHFAAETSVEELARSVGMSVSSFHLHFKKVTGVSPLNYIRSFRLDRARSMIATGQKTIGEAANAVGYKSNSQFSRDYKTHFGSPPQEHLPRELAV